MVDEKKLQHEISKILDTAEVSHVLCYKKGTYGFQTAPFFVSKKQDIEKVIFNPFCWYNLSTYIKFENEEKKIGIVVKGCDSRSLMELLKEQQISRDRLFIIGIPCSGVIDPKKMKHKIKEELTDINIEERNGKYTFTIKGEKRDFLKKDIIFDKCLACEYPTPLVYDLLLDKKIETLGKEKYAKVKDFEKKSLKEKWDFWEEQFSRCIRCYACRNVCPVCFCKECMVEQLDPQWLCRSVNVSENTTWNIMRAFHVAGRCTSCGECERVCPMNIPLMLLNKKIEKEVKELFNYIPGIDSKGKTVFALFKPDDPEGEIQ